MSEYDVPDDALTEIAELAPELSDKERKYIYWRTMAVNPSEALQRAGYSGGTWRTVETRPRVRDAFRALSERLEPKYAVTLDKVVGILYDAVEMAKLKEQPKVLVEAAMALANVTGIAAATKYQIEQRSLVARIEPENMPALKHMPRRGLENLLDIHRMLPEKEVIEGELIEKDTYK